MALVKVVIDRAVLQENFRELKRRFDPKVSIGAVVKSDAYGHGLLECARTFLNEGAAFLVVSLLNEGVELRDKDVSGPVLLIGGIWPEESEECIAQGLVPVISGPEPLTQLSKAACKLQKPARIHIKVDTGMGRLGVLPEKLQELLNMAVHLPGISVEGLMSHFGVADSEKAEDQAYTTWQIREFKKLVDQVKGGIPSLKWIHLASSSGALKFKDARWNLVRLGLSLYGGVRHECVPVREAMEVTSKILYVKEMPEGKFLSYGRAYRTERKTRVAIIPVGYASGYLKWFSNKGEMLVRGKRAPVLGRVCMDLTLVDITSIPEASIGDKVTILGRQGDEEVSVFQLSEWAGTIPYEIFCLLGGSAHVKKEYIN